MIVGKPSASAEAIGTASHTADIESNADTMYRLCSARCVAVDDLRRDLSEKERIVRGWTIFFLACGFFAQLRDGGWETRRIRRGDRHSVLVVCWLSVAEGVQGRYPHVVLRASDQFRDIIPESEELHRSSDNHAVMVSVAQSIR